MGLDAIELNPPRTAADVGARSFSVSFRRLNVFFDLVFSGVCGFLFVVAILVTSWKKGEPRPVRAG